MKGLLKRHRPGAGVQVARWTLDQPPQLRTLRSALQTAVRSRALPATVDMTDLLERLLIVATELAGNALRHGQPPAVVALLHADGHLIVDVADRDPAGEPAVDDQRPAGTGGLGLPLAQRLAEDVGWYATDDGKHVWAAIAVAPA
jgi:anti-sigma regulatory factor (Ser/Thr protein kinase)